MLMALFQNKESLSSNKTTRLCGQADKNVQLQARPRGLIGVRRKFNLLLHPIVIRRLTLYFLTNIHFQILHSKMSPALFYTCLFLISFLLVFH
jgi:hypothetical protein